MTDQHPENDHQVLHLKNESAVDTHHTIDHTEINEHFSNIKNDLNQIEKLVNDAVTNLIVNFTHVNELHQSQHVMTLNIDKQTASEMRAPIQESLQQQMIIAEKIEHELKSALVSLQFGDLVSQLLVHTIKQVDVLNLALEHHDMLQNEQQNSTVKHRTHQEISLALQQSQFRKLNKPVEQHEIQTGGIELF